MSYLCRNGHVHSKQFLAEDCATCRRQERQRRERVTPPAPDGMCNGCDGILIHASDCEFSGGVEP